MLFLLFAVFVFGFSAGHFKIFPYQIISGTKDHVSDFLTSFRTGTVSELRESDEIIDTFLTRLITRKIPLPHYDGFGGGIAHATNIFFIVTNKGEVFAYDINLLSQLEGSVDDVPMSLQEFMGADFRQRNNFRTIWMRVNGIHAEQNSDGEYTLFVSHNGFDQEGMCITHNVSRIRLNQVGREIRTITDWETLFTAKPCIDPEPNNYSGAVYSGHISGGEIVSYNDNKLLVSVGDYNRNGINETPAYALNEQVPYGKTLLIDKLTGEWDVFTSGHRNLTGIYIDENSKVWSVENGPEGGDELNKLVMGEEYGWPEVSYGYWYQPEQLLPGDSLRGEHANYRKPFFSWIPAVAPSGLIRMESERFPHWKSDILVGTMRDRNLLRLRLDDNDRVTYSERIHLGHRIRDMEQLPDGKVLILTDDQYLIAIDNGGLPFEGVEKIPAERFAELADFAKMFSGKHPVRQQTAKTIYERNCASCHNLQAPSIVGPHLGDLQGRQVGGLSDFNYSSALEADTRVWNSQTLESFLLKPEQEFTGNKMPAMNLSAAEVDSIIHFLFESEIN